jgi:DNA (cytosine-5)-methyltransferase 1
MIKAIDFFCGGGGMTRGLKDAGIEVLAGIDIDGKCKDTYEYNNTPAKFIEKNIATFEIDALEKGYSTEDGTKIKIERDDKNLLFVGCSPCQYFSLMSTDKKKSESSKNLLEDFQNFVDYYNPGYVVVENVPGILSHPESPLKKFIYFLDKKGYFSLAFNTIKVYEYGVPQTRKRFILIASRVKYVLLPEPEETRIPTVRDLLEILSETRKYFLPLKRGTKTKPIFVIQPRD